jgi:hypothetical protein
MKTGKLTTGTERQESGVCYLDVVPKRDSQMHNRNVSKKSRRNSILDFNGTG